MYTPPPEDYQIGLLDGECHDTRTKKQRRLSRNRALPKQLPMFDNQSTFEQAMTRLPAGVPVNSKGQPVALALMMQDNRSAEEVEQDIIQDNAVPMFEDNQLVSKGAIND